MQTLFALGNQLFASLWIMEAEATELETSSAKLFIFRLFLNFLLM